MPSTLVVVGAGPKAIAIAAKAAALRELDIPAPTILVIEQNGVAANWTGLNGYTNGGHRLGTAPQKDVGYPYDSEFGEQVSSFTFAFFSWPSYLISSPMRYGDWIDRGCPHPKHTEWASYLKWVWEKVEESGVAELITGTVTRAEVSDHGEVGDRCWDVTVSQAAGDLHVTGDGLVFTGPGASRTLPILNADGSTVPSHPRVYDGKDFWKRLPEIDAIPAVEDEVFCVVGSGETAASIVVEILERRPKSAVIVTNRYGTIFSRGEGFHENRLFTEAGEEWRALPKHIRAGVIARADRGVFSLETLNVINLSERVSHQFSDVKAIVVSPYANSEPLRVDGTSVDPSTGACTELSIYASFVIVAAGFNDWSFVDVLHPQSMIPETDRERLKSSMLPDLSLQVELGGPKLHVPMLCGEAQGPGFPNLSCLGTLADRILRPYVPDVQVVPLFQA